MATFKFRLQGLLRLRESQRDEALLLLAELLRCDARLIEDRTALDDAATTARAELGAVAPGPVDLRRQRDLQSYEAGLRHLRQAIDTQRHSLEPQIAERRESLKVAQRELRLVEQLAEREAAEHRAAGERQAQREMDELFAARALVPYRTFADALAPAPDEAD